MGKRRDNPGQTAFAFDAPLPASLPAALAGLESQIARAVSAILHADDRRRSLIAAEIADLLDEEVSENMLSAYASQAREGHKVPLSRFMALIAVTGRFDVLDQLVRQIGAAVLVGEEVHTARLGHIDRQIEKLREERRRIAGRAPLIGGDADK